MGRSPASAIGWLFDEQHGCPDRLIPRWVFLRTLGAICFSAFFSLVFQIRGLIGPAGILPASEYLHSVAQSLGHWQRIWYAPTVLWFSSGNSMLSTLAWVGMAASLLLVINIWPRGMLVICFVCFLSFVSAAQDFSGYQSDGMLLEASFLSCFLAPGGWRPGLGRTTPVLRAGLFLLLWEWFRIYFESGVVKLLSGDPEWRHFTAMDEYYQNGPLPTWIGWYVQHLPHWFHAGTVYATLALELGLVWMLFLPRSLRHGCFFIVTVWQIGVILTANYAFLNYLVLVLGILLIDDKFVVANLPKTWSSRVNAAISPQEAVSHEEKRPPEQRLRLLKVAIGAVLLTWIFYASTAQLAWMFTKVSLPTSPVAALEPFRVANRYGLFAVMTRGRYEIEFQGSSDGENWQAYPFRYKPQELSQPPGIYAPYQPRFDWNLWFASLGSWREYPIVLSTQERLLANDRDVLRLFAANPFSRQPPRVIRVVLWRYWFTTMAEKRTFGTWWRRQFMGLYGPTLERDANGNLKVVEWPTVGPTQ
jgi:lipase maturation factor 1